MREREIQRGRGRHDNTGNLSFIHKDDVDDNVDYNVDEYDDENTQIQRERHKELILYPYR